MTFGKNLQTLREKQGLSQKELANLVGANTGTIAEWEADDSIPSIAELARLSKALNVSSDVLLDNAPEETVLPTPTTKVDTVVPAKKRTKAKRIIVIASILLGLALVCVLLWGLGVFNTSFSKDTKRIEKADASVVKIYCYDYDGNLAATGSGFLAFNGKTVITNYHVMTSAYTCKVSTNQDISFAVAKILCYSEEYDIAILELYKDTGLKPLKLGNSSSIKKGETVVAIGSPLGIKNTVSTGVLSGRLMQNSMDVLQFTAPISSGSSGGALFDDNGNVIGITFASFVDGQNLNLAIPIELANSLYEKKGASKNISAIYLEKHPYITLLQQYKDVPEITIDELLRNPEKYDSKTVKIIGYFSSTYSYLSDISNRYINLAFIATANSVTSDGEVAYRHETESSRNGLIPRLMSFSYGDKCYFDSQIKPGDKICLIAEIIYQEFSHGGIFLWPSIHLAYGPI